MPNRLFIICQNFSHMFSFKNSRNMKFDSQSRQMKFLIPNFGNNHHTSSNVLINPP